MSPFLFFLLLDQGLKIVSVKLGWARINRELAWGVFPGVSAQKLVFFDLFLLGALFLSTKSGKVNKNPALYIIITGGLSNLFDRLIRGGVVDYLHLWIIPSFNLADLAITVGIIFLVFESIKPNFQVK